MSDQSEPTPPEASHPRYPLSPQPVLYSVAIATVKDGSLLCAITMADVNGERVYFIGAENAVRLGAEINRVGREIMVQESMHKPKLIMPNGQTHIVRPPDDGGQEAQPT